MSTGASLPPGTHTIPLSQLQGQPLAIQGPVAPGPAATLHASSTQPTTLLRLPTTVSLSGQHAATRPAHLTERERESVCGWVYSYLCEDQDILSGLLSEGPHLVLWFRVWASVLTKIEKHLCVVCCCSAF